MIKHTQKKKQKKGLQNSVLNGLVTPVRSISQRT